MRAVAWFLAGVAVGAQAQSVTPFDGSASVRLSQQPAPPQAVASQPPGPLQRLSAGFDHWISSPRVASTLGEAGAKLRDGPHLVASSEGEHVVALIRSLPSSEGTKRQQVLEQLIDLQLQGNPEATTFFGFATEYGLFGVRRDPAKAGSYYAAAASAGYPPALYDLALRDAYGRGQPRDVASALRLLDRASAAGTERSYRICGLGAFLSLREGHAIPQAFTSGCQSPLAELATLSTTPGALDATRVEGLHKTMATGADDGDLVIENRARQAFNDGLPAADTFCRYHLLNQYRAGHVKHDELQTQAMLCVQDAPRTQATASDQAQSSQAAAGIASFVSSEASAIDKARRTNHFHYSWSVPYLPFTAEDAVLFEAVMPAPQTHLGGS
jgi:hypothetical protein